jgi:hypothetical protein
MAVGNSLEVKEWLAARKAEALLIDPETAEVHFIYGQTLDPYNVIPDLPEELQQIGREYFARRPGGQIWVHFSDLPDDVREKLWRRAPTLRDDLSGSATTRARTKSPFEVDAGRRSGRDR